MSIQSMLPATVELSKPDSPVGSLIIAGSIYSIPCPRDSHLGLLVAACRTLGQADLICVWVTGGRRGIRSDVRSGIKGGDNGERGVRESEKQRRAERCRNRINLFIGPPAGISSVCIIPSK